jgi:predicted dehydrogenase
MFGTTPAGLVGFLGVTPWARVDVSTRSTVRVRQVTLRCEEGVASLPDAGADHIEVIRGIPDRGQSAEPAHRLVSPEPPLLRELRAFIAHVQGGPPPLSSAAEGAETCRAVATLRHLAGLPN